MDFTDEDTRSWKQHYPTYGYKRRDIVVEEYKLAAALLEVEEKVFAGVSSFVSFLGAVMAYVFVGGGLSAIVTLSDRNRILFFSSVLYVALILIFSAMISYFAYRQKISVFSARKVVILREILGMDYGALQLVLHRGRHDGASKPFSIKIFNGWISSAAYPFYVSSALLACSLMIFVDRIAREVQFELTDFQYGIIVFAASFIPVIIVGLVYRISLFDVHERMLLLVGRFLAWILRVKMVDDIEYVIYRSRLSGYEVERLKVKSEDFFKILVNIEDKSYYRHGGVSFRGIVRALLHILLRKKRVGGSTITQQLARSLFIIDQKKVYRRKTVEIILAFWVNSILSKREQLEMYIGSVRFEHGVYGVIPAMKYFFGDIVVKPSEAQVFFLIERVSNINSKVLLNKILQQCRALVADGVISKEVVCEIGDVYHDAVQRKVVKGDDFLKERFIFQ
ncbi:biosynthetic peptidoglycan transglycosylase [Desulfovibrio psychrotolerans]|uniref:Glycosyl transferase family 51 domain-containing protein n=1 Tax=Desulfovibrio psychrotolerans TaxID=415242 RepID=A0A7J0BVN1_9BACT|nr:biosynthetic peptidoglycan transglycosylase [Desulfovibrio psychrotolerans]GFM37770.1 hypothetical protein DSM19430T_24540 [Desulfovibrio psychrotolerans]